jgi:spoIIIJ-associated protein
MMTESEIKKHVEEFIQKTGFAFDTVSIELDQDSGSFWIKIASQDARALIGRDGETIQAINFLIKRIFETKAGEQSPRIIIDVNDYQKSRIDRIKTIAYMMAERARFFKSKVELEPMNAFERRIVHDFVSKHEDLASESTGFGQSRRVVISYKEKL